jgi:hypothetical protein
MERQFNSFRPKLQVETLLVRMSLDAAESFSKCFGVTVRTSRTDLRASCNTGFHVALVHSMLEFSLTFLFPFSSLFYLHLGIVTKKHICNDYSR